MSEFAFISHINWSASFSDTESQSNTGKFSLLAGPHLSQEDSDETAASSVDLDDVFLTFEVGYVLAFFSHRSPILLLDCLEEFLFLARPGF